LPDEFFQPFRIKGGNVPYFGLLRMGGNFREFYFVKSPPQPEHIYHENRVPGLVGQFVSTLKKWSVLVKKRQPVSVLHTGRSLVGDEHEQAWLVTVFHHFPASAGHTGEV